MRHSFYVTWLNAWGQPNSRGFKTIAECFAFAESANLTKFKVV